ncbi:MAG: hypothetical protein NC328_04255 [Muribaculum sp.]|nr:hypothetical protein [Muribaculum sp.]
MKTTSNLFSYCIVILVSLGFAMQGYSNSNVTVSTDSISTGNESVATLDEIVVEGKNRYIKDNVYTVIPDKQQKNAAYDGVDMLRLLNIPLLKVSPLNNSVTTVSGETVKYFINGLPATETEINSMNPNDAVRVEFIDHPTEPEFNGVAYAVNYIMKEYKSGGYTRINEQNYLLYELANDLSLYSKFSYKKMTYDVSVGYNAYSTKHQGTSSEETFFLKDDEGNPFKVAQNSVFSKGRRIVAGIPIVFRARYAGKNCVIDNRLTYQFERTPKYDMSGFLNQFSPSENFSDIYHSHTSKKSIGISWNGSYRIYLPKNWNLSIFPTIRYSKNNSNYRYYTELDKSPEIINNNYGHTISEYLELSISKTFNRIHSISIDIDERGGLYKNNYSGSSTFTSDIKSIDGHLRLMYALKSNNFYFNIYQHLTLNHINSNRYITNRFSPSVGTNIGYTFNSGSSISSYISYDNYAPSVGDWTDGVIRQSQFLYITGSQNLKNTGHTSAHVRYTWIFRNLFDLTVQPRYEGSHNQLMYWYEPYDDGKALIRKFSNNGDFHNISAYLGLSFYLLDRSLALRAGASYNHYKSTGDYRSHLNSWDVAAHAQYFIKNFVFTLYYGTVTKSMNDQQSMITRIPQQYGLIAQWGSPRWKVNVSISNIFRKSRKYRDEYFVSPYYSYNNEVFGNNLNKSISLSVAYIFSYGKKIEQGEEIGVGKGIESGVLQ